MGAIRPTEARVDLRRLSDNFRCLRSVIGADVGVVAVVKADAYGHGAVEVARLLEGVGVWGFGVATAEEGAELRGGGIRLPVLVMGAAFGDGHDTVVAHDLTPVVGDVGDVDRFAAAAARANRVRFGIHVKVDTGMTRLGVLPEQLADFVRRCACYPSIRVDGLATHFACAEEADVSHTLEQQTRFVAALDEIRSLGGDPQVIHAANSAATLRFPQCRFDLVRPGIVLYGALPSAQVPDPGFAPVMSLRTRINAMRDVPAGTSVSYGATFTTTRKSRIATLPVGYADGYPRALSGRAEVIVRGKRVKQVGRVCMDLTMVDVTDVPDARVGDVVTLLGADGDEVITPDELAGWAQTIAYEMLAGIGKRVPRVYVGQERIAPSPPRALDDRHGRPRDDNESSERAGA